MRLILPTISSGFIIIAVVCLLKLTPERISDDIMAAVTPKPSLRERAKRLRENKRRTGLFAKLNHIRSALRSMGRGNRFAFVCCASLALFAGGAVIAVLIDNLFMLPVVSVAMALLPFIYVRNTMSYYDRHTKEELETTLSIITTSYVRSDDIVSAVNENLSYIRPPINEVFRAFVGDATAVSSSTKQAIRGLKDKIDDEIFREWCDTLIQCQDDRTLKDTLQSVVGKLTDVRIVNNELNTMMSAVKMEYLTMAGLVVGNIPLLYVLNKDWFNTLVYETLGKIVLGVCGAVILVTYLFLIRYTKPIEYKG